MASPWEIGSAHWNQRDLYTTSASIEDDGYAVGPRVHPDVGSFAYTRDTVVAVHEPPSSLRDVHAREAWPWLNYHVGEEHHPVEPLFRRVVDKIVTAFAGRSPEVIATDERLVADVRGALAARRDIETRGIDVSSRDAEVTLHGVVPSRRMKADAEAVARACDRVRAVHNKLRVHHDDDVLFLMPLKALNV